MTEPFDVDEAIDGYTLRVEEARICLRPDLLSEHRQLELDLVAAHKDGREDEMPAIAERITALEAAMRDAERVFRFQSISKEQWSNLLVDHPPTESQLEADKGLDHNPDTFPIAAIAASAVDPTLTVDQVKRIHQKWRFTDFQFLWGATLAANLEVAAVPKSELAGVILRTNVSSSITADRKVSRARRSSGTSAARSRPTSTTPTDA